MSWSSVFGRSLISLMSTTAWLRLACAAFFFSSYLYLPKSRILHTGGSALGLISTRSSPCSCAMRKCFVSLQHPELAAVGTDDEDLGNSDAVIDSDLVSALLLTRVEPGMPKCHLFCDVTSVYGVA